MDLQHHREPRLLKQIGLELITIIPRLQIKLLGN